MNMKMHLLISRFFGGKISPFGKLKNKPTNKGEK
jgi:hypothetical protein